MITDMVKSSKNKVDDDSQGYLLKRCIACEQAKDITFWMVISFSCKSDLWLDAVVGFHKYCTA